MKGVMRKKRDENKRYEFLRPPQLLILDSEGYLHHFRYSYGNSSVPITPNLTHLLPIEEFVKRQEKLKLNLTPKKRSRGKSQCRRTAIVFAPVQKKRSKSQIRRVLSPSEINALYDLFLF